VVAALACARRAQVLFFHLLNAGADELVDALQQALTALGGGEVQADLLVFARAASATNAAQPSSSPGARWPAVRAVKTRGALG
jgi:hypothetical protein